MNLVVPALIALVILMGLIAIGVGHRGWNWGTIAGAILLLLAAGGYFYLAARLADRERAWRTKVAANEKEIAKLLDASGSGESLVALRGKRDRWRRVQTFVDTWRGRSWQATEFQPPQGGKPGTIAVKMSSAEAAATPINAGAELSIFDDADVQEGGKFLGIFRVVSVQTAETSCQIGLVAAESPLPPSDADKALWSRQYDKVTVYEHLPVDRWVAFQTLVGHAQDDGGEGAGGDDRWLPKPQKTPDDRLRRLEEMMKQPKHHDEEIPEEEWQAEAGKLARGEIPPGSLWAVVEFENAVKYAPKGGFAVDDTNDAPAPAAEEKPDDDEGPVGAPGEMQAPGEMIDPNAPKGEARSFAKGATAEFDYQTAVGLQDDKHWCRIKSVIYRRPLTDPYTALRGGDTSEGMFRIKQALLGEIAAIERNMGRIASSSKNVAVQSERAAEQKGDLQDDLAEWAKDIAAAETTATAFDRRLKAATMELGGLEAEIVDLGRQLRGAVATLTQTIDAATPPPVLQR